MSTLHAPFIPRGRPAAERTLSRHPHHIARRRYASPRRPHQYSGGQARGQYAVCTGHRKPGCFGNCPVPLGQSHRAV